MEGQSDENLSMDVLVDDLVTFVQTIFKDVETSPVLMVTQFSSCTTPLQRYSCTVVLDSS